MQICTSISRYLTRHVIPVFGFPNYRGKQQEIIEAAMQGIHYHVSKEQDFT
jgi:hypothetical protein